MADREHRESPTADRSFHNARRENGLTTAPPDWESYDDQGKGWYFHSREGFHFRGRGDAVTIAVKCDGGYRVVTLPPNEWASVVAAVSKRGDVQSAYHDALGVHEAE